jgi:hypothetical protein
MKTRNLNGASQTTCTCGSRPKHGENFSSLFFRIGDRASRQIAAAFGGYYRPGAMAAKSRSPSHSIVSIVAVVIPHPLANREGECDPL